MNAPEFLDRLLDFAARGGLVVDALPDTRLGRHVAGQLVRSCTSPPPNYAEGCAAESKDDFIHKLSIVHKEIVETNVWLKFIARAKLRPLKRVELLLSKGKQLDRMVGASLVTAKKSRSRT